MSAGKRGAPPEDGLALSSRARRILDEAAAEAGRAGGSTITPDTCWPRSRASQGIAAATSGRRAARRRGIVAPRRPPRPWERTPGRAEDRPPNAPPAGSRGRSERSSGRRNLRPQPAHRSSSNPPGASAPSGGRAGTVTSSAPHNRRSRAGAPGPPAGRACQASRRVAAPIGAAASTDAPPPEAPPSASPRSSGTRFGSSCGTSSSPPSRPASGWPGRARITSWSSSSPVSASFRSPRPR